MTQPCPGCGCDAMEPEQDGDLHFYACTDCGYETGWAMQRANDADRCAVGIPEPVRRAASRAPSSPLLLQIGRRPA